MWVYRTAIFTDSEYSTTDYIFPNVTLHRAERYRSSAAQLISAQHDSETIISMTNGRHDTRRQLSSCTAQGYLHDTASDTISDRQRDDFAFRVLRTRSWGVTRLLNGLLHLGLKLAAGRQQM